MVLAAGFGQRMRPITATLPKPLIKVGGRALIDYSLDRLAEAGIARAVVNVHHLADQVEAHLTARRAPPIVISDERALLLETGGGLKKALPAPRGRAVPDPQFRLALDRGIAAEPRRASSRSGTRSRMDILMLLAATATSIGYEGRGDFAMDPHGACGAGASGRSRPSSLRASRS